MLIELKNAIKKEILFRTEDGIAIQIGDSYWVLNTKVDNWIFEENAARDNINYFYKNKSYAEKTGIYYFSTKKAAEEYILMNKPCLSLNDVASIYPGIRKDHSTASHQAERLKELVKSKL